MVTDQDAASDLLTSTDLVVSSLAPLPLGYDKVTEVSLIFIQPGQNPG